MISRAWKQVSVVGLILTAFDVTIAIETPTIAGRFAGPDTASQEYWLAVRYYVGISLVLIGTAMQAATLVREINEPKRRTRKTSKKKARRPKPTPLKR